MSSFWLAVDDPDGQYNITAHQILPNHPSFEPARSLPASESSKTKPIYRYVPKNAQANTSSSNTRGNLGGSSIREDTSGYATKEAKRPVFPNYRVGDTLSIKGRVNEWRRRDGRMIRELNANLSMGGEIGTFVCLVIAAEMLLRPSADMLAGSCRVQ
jgi:hypothetical protein